MKTWELGQPPWGIVFLESTESTKMVEVCVARLHILATRLSRTQSLHTVDPEVLKTVTKMAADVSNGSALPKEVVQTAAVQTLVACQQKKLQVHPRLVPQDILLKANWFRASHSAKPFVKSV